jgi:N-methylhydantoinase A/oxoprolinase/acetone carboxylase beta subunit
MIENGTGAASEALKGKKTNRTSTTPKLAVQKKALMPPTSNYKLGIEVGNVFTNFALQNVANGALYFEKMVTTYPDSIDGILTGINFLLETYKVSVKHVRTIIHGTTFLNRVITKMPSELDLYECTDATAINTFFQPSANEYFDILEKNLEKIGFKGIIRIENSAGHLITLVEARKCPFQLLEAEAAGGVMASSFISKMLKISHLCTFDIGGISAKVALIQDGQIERKHFFNTINGNPFDLPVRLDRIHRIELGIGGHSIVQTEGSDCLMFNNSLLRPTCFGDRNDAPTVTDAHLVLGFLDENYFLGGKIILRKNLAIKTLEDKLAKPLCISVEMAAEMIHQMVHTKMTTIGRHQLLEQGLDPRTFPMIAYGSTGTIHAFAVARALGVPQLIIPVGAGVAGALGLLVSPMVVEEMMAYIQTISNFDWQKINIFLYQAEMKALGYLKRASISVAQSTVRRFATMRYVNEEPEIMVALPNESHLSVTSISTIEQNFDTVYWSKYGHLMPESAREVVALHVIVSSSVPNLPFKQLTYRTKHHSLAVKGHRSVYFEGNWLKCIVYDRYALRAGDALQSPALIEEAECTTFIGAPSTIHLDRFENIIVNLQSNDE